MKLSKYVRLVKDGGYCIVAHVAGSGIWLGTRTAIYKATELPDMAGEDQVRTVLDVPEKEWEKVYLKEEYHDSINNIFGMNLASYEEGEQDTEKINMMALPHGLRASCRRCMDDGELIFYDERLLAPLAEQIKDSDYITYTARKTASGLRYLVVHDGFAVLAAIMPMKVVSDGFLADLSEFQAICTEQFYREKQRAAEATEQSGEPEAEQIGMEESGAQDETN